MTSSQKRNKVTYYISNPKAPSTDAEYSEETKDEEATSKAKWTEPFQPKICGNSRKIKKRKN